MCACSIASSNTVVCPFSIFKLYAILFSLSFVLFAAPPSLLLLSLPLLKPYLLSPAIQEFNVVVEPCDLQPGTFQGSSPPRICLPSCGGLPTPDLQKQLMPPLRAINASSPPIPFSLHLSFSLCQRLPEDGCLSPYRWTPHTVLSTLDLCNYCLRRRQLMHGQVQRCWHLLSRLSFYLLDIVQAST